MTLILPSFGEARTAEELSRWAFSDSHVDLDREVLIEQLRDDLACAGRLPTDSECELLITGGDEGEVPEELRELFPLTCDFIGSYWE